MKLYYLQSLLLISFCFFLSNTSAQTYTMTDGGNESTCSGTFLDPGGTANYPGGQNSTITYTICSSNGDILKLAFNSFKLYSNSCIWGASVDKLKIYDGPNTSSTLIGTYSNSDLNGQSVYGSSGCLTFVFIREDKGGLGCSANNGQPGWDATISCVTSIPPTGDICTQAMPFCSDQSYDFPNNTTGTAPVGPDYAFCSSLNPIVNPIWYYMEIGTAGNIKIQISQTTGQNGSGSGLDVDFCLWGPFTSLSAGCAAIMSGVHPIQRSWDPSPTETLGIGVQGGTNTWCSSPYGQSTPPPAQVGEFYIVMLTNADGSPGYFSFNQSNNGQAGAGSTNCGIVEQCSIDNLTASPSACDPASDTYSVSGAISFTSSPSTGQLIVEDCNGNQVTAASAPFTSPVNYSIPNLNSNGAGCNVKAYFSDNSSCTKTTNFTAPASCNPCSANAGTLSGTTTVCIGGNTVIASNGNTGGTWSSSNTTIATVDNTGNVTCLSAGTTSIQYTVTGTGGCSDVASINLTVNAQTTPAFTIPEPICNGNTFTLPATSNNSINGTWSPAINNTATTTYTFTPSTGQCASNTTVQVVVNAVPNQPTVDTSLASCNENGTAKISNYDGSVSYIFNPAGPSVDNSGNINGLNPAVNYSVKASKNACISDSTTFAVETQLPSGFSVSITPNPAIIDEGENIQLNANMSPYIPGSSYLWTPSHDLSCSNCPSPVATPVSDTNYYQLTITNPDGCSISANAKIIVKIKCGDIFIPNIFTPNGDNQNDTFRPHGRCIVKIDMAIFDRWGNKVFHTNDIKQGWDGTERGQKAQTGSYVYSISIGLKNGETKAFHGSVDLIR